MTVNNDCFLLSEDGNSIIRKTYLGDEKYFEDRLSLDGLIAGKGTDLEELYDKAWLRQKTKPVQTGARGVIRAADLFCGCGGLTLGAEEACRALGFAFQSVYASDINEAALGVYKRNFPTAVTSSDAVETVLDSDLGQPLSEAETCFKASVGRVHLLLGGPPCQGNSDLNNHTRRNDPKNLLYLRMVRCAEVLRPDALIIENVPGVAHDVHNVLDTAVSHLMSMGYHVNYRTVQMDLIGVPQKRKRLFLIASKGEQIFIDGVVAAHACEPRSLRWAIEDMTGAYDEEDIYDSSATHSFTNKRRIDYLFDHDLHDLPNSERPDCHRLKAHSYTAVYGRMYWDIPSPTITGGFGSTGQGRFVHPSERRTLTPHEAARVQFFPDYFRFDGILRRELQQLIGNAVPSKTSYILALELLRHLEIENEGA